MTDNNGNNGRRFGRLKNIANIGDIVTADGYEGREFQVESYTHELDYQPDYIAETIIYDLTDIVTFEYLMAYQEDISVKIKAEDADEYLKNAPKKPTTFEIKPSSLDVFFPDAGAFIDIFADIKADEPAENKRDIDDMLDEIRSYKTMIGVFGKDSGRGREFAGEIERIKDELRERIK